MSNRRRCTGRQLMRGPFLPPHRTRKEALAECDRLSSSNAISHDPLGRRTETSRTRSRRTAPALRAACAKDRSKRARLRTMELPRTSRIEFRSLGGPPHAEMNSFDSRCSFRQQGSSNLDLSTTEHADDDRYSPKRRAVRSDLSRSSTRKPDVHSLAAAALPHTPAPTTITSKSPDGITLVQARGMDGSRSRSLRGASPTCGFSTRPSIQNLSTSA